MINNSIYLRRRQKIVLPSSESVVPLPPNYVPTLLKNIENLGYVFSKPLIEACGKLSLEEMSLFYLSLVEDLKKSKGAHQIHNPMYPNFPQQVMSMSSASLYLNAVFHYITSGKFLPKSEKQSREPLLEATKLQVIELGNVPEFEALFGQLAGSNASLSEQDKEDIVWFIESYGSKIDRLLPENIPQKENIAFIADLLIRHTEIAKQFLSRYCQTATDALRLAVAMSGGDVSLAQPVKFRSFSRRERKLILELLDSKSNLVEDMLRWRSRWIRLGERLHPGEYAKSFPKIAEAFTILRNDIPVETFNSVVEKSLAEKNVGEATNRLKTRPGEFARRLDYLLRIDPESHFFVLRAFLMEAGGVSTPVLLQVMAHFKHRHERASNRIFFPKGNVGKAHVADNTLPEIENDVCLKVVEICRNALIERFQSLEPLGKVLLDKSLSRFLIPSSQRSASKSLRTITRGSRVPLPENCNVLRFFIWWKNGTDRADIDLSAVMYDSHFDLKGLVSYYNLKEFGGVHSGDIVDAPKGASEFIDLPIKTVLGERHTLCRHVAQ